MTAKDSQADRSLRALFQSDENPVDLAAKMTRASDNFVASPVPGTHSYILGWTERTQVVGKPPVSWRCSGSASIAAPEIPTDVTLAAVDPAGVFVEAYSFHCQPEGN
jgi:hypothetical protein